MTEQDRPNRPPYSALVRLIGEQARELYPRAEWDEVESELSRLWKSYVTGLPWSEVAVRIRSAWEDADPSVEKH
jgi:hypothetical protein